MNIRTLKILYLIFSAFIGYGIYLVVAIYEDQQENFNELPIVEKLEVTNYDPQTPQEHREAAIMRNEIKSWSDVIRSYRFMIAFYGASVITFLFMFVYCNYFINNELGDM